MHSEPFLSGYYTHRLSTIIIPGSMFKISITKTMELSWCPISDHNGKWNVICDKSPLFFVVEIHLWNAVSGNQSSPVRHRLCLLLVRETSGMQPMGSRMTCEQGEFQVYFTRLRLVGE